jgi:hypothetical protein
MTETPPRRASEMTPEEAAATLRALKRAPVPEPMPTDVQARNMTPEQRTAFLREVNRRWG